MKQNQIMNMINRELRKEKIYQLEDEFTLAVTEDLLQRKNLIEEMFDEYIKSLSECILKKNDVNYEMIINQYQELNIQTDYFCSNEYTIFVLEANRGLMEKIQRGYHSAIYKTFAIVNCLDLRRMNFQYDVLNKGLLNKITSIVDEDIMKYNQILMEKNQIAFELILEVLDDVLDDTEIIDDLETLEETIKKYKYIEDYKEMNRLAEELGFTYKSQNGSHRKFEHKTTCKCVTIPQHTLGYGLSLKIQKELDNAVV